MTLASPAPFPSRPERLFTVAEYLRMVGAGILSKYDRVELIEGRIVEKMARNPPHESSLQYVLALLMETCPAEWVLRCQSALELRRSVPEPEFIVLRGPKDRYNDRLPEAADVILAVEISDSTLRDDRETMGRIYAEAGIPAYWVVNLIDRQVEIYSDPTGRDTPPVYRVRRDVNERELAVLVTEGHRLELPVSEMLPKVSM